MQAFVNVHRFDFQARLARGLLHEDVEHVFIDVYKSGVQFSLVSVRPRCKIFFNVLAFVSFAVRPVFVQLLEKGPVIPGGSLQKH